MLFSLSPTKKIEKLERQQTEEVEARLLVLARSEFPAIFDRISQLSLCVPLTHLKNAERGVINAVNGMILVEGDARGGGKYLEIRTLPNSIGSTYTSNVRTECCTEFTIEEARKLLRVWTVMSKPYEEMQE